MFVIIAAILIILVILFIALPLFRNSEEKLSAEIYSAGGEGLTDLETEKQNILASLTDMEADLQGGKLAQADYSHLKDIEEHRLAAILDKIDSAVTEAGQIQGNQAAEGSIVPASRFRGMNRAGFILLIILVAGGTSGVYYYLNMGFQGHNTEAMMESQPGPAAEEAASIPEMVARLERKLRENPDDLQGQIMAGRSYMTMQRDEDAMNAWNKVAELDPANAEAQYSIGYLLIQNAESGDTRSFEQAIRHFDKALLLSPGLPAAFYYKGLALTHLNRQDEAESNWKSALQGLPPDSEDAKFVMDALRKLKNGNP